MTTLSKRLIPIVLFMALLIDSHQGFSQKVKTKLITYRGITMKVPDTSPDFNSQDPSASLKVSEEIMIHFRLMPNMVSNEQAALEFADKFWETRSKERGIPMQMALDAVSYYFIAGEDSRGGTDYLLAGANAYEEYYGIYVSYGDPANAKLSKKALRSIRVAKTMPAPYEAPAMTLKTVSYGALQFEVPEQVKVQEIEEGIALTFENMYVATLKTVNVTSERNELDDKEFTEVLDRSNKRVLSGPGYRLAPGWEKALICFKNAGDYGTIYVDNQGKYVGIELGNLIYTELKSAIPEMKSYCAGVHQGNNEEGYVVNLNVISEPGQKFGQDLLEALSR